MGNPLCLVRRLRRRQQCNRTSRITGMPLPKSEAQPPNMADSTAKTDLKESKWNKYMGVFSLVYDIHLILLQSIAISALYAGFIHFGPQFAATVYDTFPNGTLQINLQLKIFDPSPSACFDIEKAYYIVETALRILCVVGAIALLYRILQLNQTKECGLIRATLLLVVLWFVLECAMAFLLSCWFYCIAVFFAIVGRGKEGCPCEPEHICIMFGSLIAFLSTVILQQFCMGIVRFAYEQLRSAYVKGESLPFHQFEQVPPVSYGKKPLLF